MVGLYKTVSDPTVGGFKDICLSCFNATQRNARVVKTFVYR